jgi:hypothetical protein
MRSAGILEADATMKAAQAHIKLLESEADEVP